MAGQLRFPNVNSVTISGRLVRDVELKFFADNRAIAKICIAVSHYFKDEHGSMKEEASFVDAVAFGMVAQRCQENLKKGSPVLIEGTLKTRSYTDSNNVNRKVTEVNINKIYPLEREEGYVSNQNNQSQTSNAGFTNQNNQPRQNVMNTPTDDSFPYQEQNYVDVNTQDDVPF